MNSGSQVVSAGPRQVDGKIIYSVESRKSLELNLADLALDGHIEIFPHVEERGLLYIQFRRNRLMVSAGPYIGLIPLTPHIIVEVLPKLPIANLARVLDAARSSLNSIAGVDRLYLAQESASSSVLEFLTANLLDSLHPIAANGLQKEYLDRSEITSHPSGRVRLAGTLRTWSRGQLHRVEARRFEQSSDIPANRLIKAALRFLLERIHPESSERSRSLIRQANDAYYGLPTVIGPLRASDYEACTAIVRRHSLPVARSYYYRPLEISLLILSNHSVALQEHGNDVLLETFVINFEELFEQYMRRVLQNRAPPHCGVKDGNRDGKKPLFDDRREPPAQPDILITRHPADQKVIGEVKYKDKPDRSDINQAITYALSYGTNRTVLIHQCRPGSPRGLKTIGMIRGIRIYAYAFDLGASDIDAEEEAFAQCLFELVRPPHVVGAAA